VISLNIYTTIPIHRHFNKEGQFVPDTMDIDSFMKKLAGQKKKLTSQRRRLLNVFLEFPDKHLSAEEIYDHLRDSDGKAGLATVYRNLEMLTEIGLLVRIEFTDGKTRYELNDASEEHPHQHHHLVCLACGNVQEFDSPLTQPLEDSITQRTGFCIKDHQIQFFGLCAKCAKEEDHRRK